LSAAGATVYALSKSQQNLDSLVAEVLQLMIKSIRQIKKTIAQSYRNRQKTK